MPLKMLIIVPHTSTGGAPSVTAKKIELLKNDYEIKVVEYTFYTHDFVVHRNKMIRLVGEENFITLRDDKRSELFSLLRMFMPDIVLVEEMPEQFMDESIMQLIYSENRTYKIFETTHDSSFDIKLKKYFPDKFTFVSPYSALQHQLPTYMYDIIEHPIDIKGRDKETARKELGLEDDFKHVVIIGLFTPRKNQAYAFDLALRMTDYKIKFHFIGNQAGNFEEYWKPLMELKGKHYLENCVVHGEKDEATVDLFLQAADLFLFPSKGDRNNKELNPIVIKEAMQYPRLPKLMYNLDVYLNRYNENEFVHFLTGDADDDSIKIVEITNPEYEHKELVIIGTYPNIREREEMTMQCIESHKKLGLPILLVSHYPASAALQQMVDFYIYDAHNPVGKHSYYQTFYSDREDYRIDVNINNIKNGNQSLAVLTNMVNGANFALIHGFRSFFYNTYDVSLYTRDVETVKAGLRTVKQKGGYLGTLGVHDGLGIQTNGMVFDTISFLNSVTKERDIESFNEECRRIGSENYLEHYFKKVFEDDECFVKINNPEGTLLVHSGLGKASNSEYYGVFPVKGFPNKYVMYFFTYNRDSRIVTMKLSQGGKTIIREDFVISDKHEHFIEFEFKGEALVADIIVSDGRKATNTPYVINAPNLFADNGLFKPKKKPKIKLVHLQTNLNLEKEIKSREEVRKVHGRGIFYINHQNPVYKSLPPAHNCMRPQCVSMELFSEEKAAEIGTSLTPAHYGCYESFKTAILSEFHDCDFLILCEGDCKIEVSTEEFVAKVYQAAELCTEHNIGYFSFGDTKTLEHGWEQSPVVEEIPNQDLAFITNHIIGLQCIMFPSFAAKFLKDELRQYPWDAMDIWLNEVFSKAPFKMGIVKQRMTGQHNGISLIDQTEKTFI